MTKSVEKRQAIELRYAGYSVDEIADKVGVAKSTVSLWVRGIPLQRKRKYSERANQNRAKITKARWKDGCYNNIVKYHSGDSERVCSCCGELKPISEFVKKGTRNDGERRESLCRTCKSARQRSARKERKLQIVAEKGGGCQKCGYHRNLAALVLHHRNSEDKDIAFSKAILMSKERLATELKKCDLLCANCHAEVHNPDLFIDSEEA